MNSLVYELPLVFASGMLGSVHCIGMCGPVSASMNAASGRLSHSIRRQCLWSCGRIFTYGFLGITAGFAGTQLADASFIRSQSTMIRIQAGFAVLAGILLVLQGLSSAGWLRRRPTVSRSGSCVPASIFGHFLNVDSNLSVLIAGLATGFLPCGLVYSFLALAAAGGSLWKGGLLMVVFGTGTFPVMLLTGVGLTMASMVMRRKLMKLAAVCVLATGLLTIGRGIAFAAAPASASPEQTCPFCSNVPNQQKNARQDRCTTDRQEQEPKQTDGDTGTNPFPGPQLPDDIQ